MRKLCVIACVILLALLVSGCSVSQTSDKKIRDLDFTVADINDVPDKVKEIVENSKSEKFQTAFSNMENTYIIVGFGQQPGNAYSIKVTELYETETDVIGSILFEGLPQPDPNATTLKNPDSNSNDKNPDLNVTTQTEADPNETTLDELNSNTSGSEQSSSNNHSQKQQDNKETENDENMGTSKEVSQCCPYIIIKIEYTEKTIKIRNGYRNNELDS